MTTVSMSASATVVVGIGAAIVLTRAADTRSGLGDADEGHAERAPAAPCPPRRSPRRRICAEVRRGRGALARDRPLARLRLRDAPDARQAPAGRGPDPARGGLSGGGRRGRPLACGAPRAPGRRAAQGGGVG